MLIKNAIIYDGTGNPPFKSDLKIYNGKIEKIKYHLDIKDNETFDTESLCIAPGFINMHSHSDLEVFRNNRMEHVIRQGVTTEIIGQDGSSVTPVTDEIITELTYNMSPLVGVLDREYWWRSFSGYKNAVKKLNSVVRVESLVGHGTIRMCVMGNVNRKPTKSELKEMKELTENCLKEGAKGLSFGLVYPPGSYAKTEEIIELSKVVAKFDGIVMVHMRDEGDRLIESIDEMIEVIRNSKVRLNISHLKALGPKNWGKVKIALKKISELRREGMDITFDHYPYSVSCTGLKRLVPDWAYDNGEKGFQSRLKKTDEYQKILSTVEYRIQSVFGGAERIVISSIPYIKNNWMIGKSLAQIAKIYNLSPGETSLKILQISPSITANYFSMNEKDIVEVMKSPWQTICTDGIMGKNPHPRTYSSFPRILGSYCRKQKIMSFEEAIRKMTSEPARRLRLWDRGLIREGLSADLVLFDPIKINDKNSYLKPKIFPEGIRAVWIKGKLIYNELFLG